MLAGLTQADLARAAGCHPRSVRYWENKGSNLPTNVASTLDSIEQASRISWRVAALGDEHMGIGVLTPELS
jgi:transcriptional regulator with XRE-family HTH domain